MGQAKTKDTLAMYATQPAVAVAVSATQAEAMADAAVAAVAARRDAVGAIVAETATPTLWAFHSVANTQWTAASERTTKTVAAVACAILYQHNVSNVAFTDAAGVTVRALAGMDPDAALATAPGQVKRVVTLGRKVAERLAALSFGVLSHGTAEKTVDVVADMIRAACGTKAGAWPTADDMAAWLGGAAKTVRSADPLKPLARSLAKAIEDRIPADILASMAAMCAAAAAVAGGEPADVTDLVRRTGNGTAARLADNAAVAEKASGKGDLNARIVTPADALSAILSALADGADAFADDATDGE